jgi:hypothetical protein
LGDRRVDGATENDDRSVGGLGSGIGVPDPNASLRRAARGGSCQNARKRRVAIKHAQDLVATQIRRFEQHAVNSCFAVYETDHPLLQIRGLPFRFPSATRRFSTFNFSPLLCFASGIAM